MTKPVPHLPVETLSTIIFCLQRCITNVNHELHEAIVSVINGCSMALKTRQQNSNPLMRARGMDGNALNQTVFAGQLYGHGVDQLQSLGTNLSNMSLAGK